PTPRAPPKEMVGGPCPGGSTAVRVSGETFPPFVAVPLFHTAEPRPHRVDRMVGIRTKMAKLSRERCRASCSVNDPTASSPAFVAVDSSVYSLAVGVV